MNDKILGSLKRMSFGDMLITTWGESYWIMEEDTQVGHIVINEHPDMYLLFRLEIFEQYRQKGYATRCIRAIPRDKKIRLAVGYGNKVAISLYKKLGFNIVGEGETWWWMELEKLS